MKELIKYFPIIGLEIHVEFATKSKMFCRCSANWFGSKPNTHTCPVCLGHPGALPVPNKKAIEYTILLAKALKCKINLQTKFDRKHYFYPDLPKGYQISQYDAPVGVNGSFICSRHPTDSEFTESKIRIRRVHLEEDTGKLIHRNVKSYVDFNRCGVPLVEIVTEPDFNSAKTVKSFLEELQIIIRTLKISDADMEKGSMRLEPNISLTKVKSERTFRSYERQLKAKTAKDKLPDYKVEVKNINSFRFCQKAIEYEIVRQSELFDKGIKPTQETRGWDENKNKTVSQRVKEESDDYRYFPEPDIPPIILKKSYVDSLKLPSLPAEKLEKYVKKYKLPYMQAYILTRNVNNSNYFEKILLKIENYGIASKIANMIVNKKLSINLPEDEFIKKIKKMIAPKDFDKNELLQVITNVCASNKKAVESYKKGKHAIIQYLIGQVMRETKGEAQASLIYKLLESELKK